MCVVSAALTSVPINIKPLVILGGVWMVKLSYLQNHTDNDHDMYLELIDGCTLQNFLIIFYDYHHVYKSSRDGGAQGSFLRVLIFSSPLCGQPWSQHHVIIIALADSFYFISSSQEDQAVSWIFHSNK